MADTAEIAVIGGSGFYDLDGLRAARPVEVSTPFGPTSSAILVGELHGKRVAFIARHGEGHRILPSEVPSRASMWALCRYRFCLLHRASSIPMAMRWR